MKPLRIQVIKPYFTEEEEKEVVETLRSGWIVQGPKVEEFEKKIADYLGVTYAVATNSCTSALHIALILSGVGKGDEVIVPSFTFIATPNSIVYTGAKPIFADIDERTYNIDPVDVERKITKKTKAILPVHQAGLAADIGALSEIAKKHNLTIIEDGACAIGARIGDTSIGAFGNICCLSFHPRKSITTGEGGMLLTDNKAFADTARMIRAHGMSISDRKRFESDTFIDEEYRILGYNYRMSDIHASIGIAQYKKLPEIMEKRTYLANRYTSAFSTNPKVIFPYIPHNYTHTFQSYLIRIKDSNLSRRNAIIQYLLDKGIETRIGIKASHLALLYSKSNSHLPVTETVAEQIITLPLYPTITDQEQNYVIDQLQDALHEIK